MKDLLRPLAPAAAIQDANGKLLLLLEFRHLLLGRGYFIQWAGEDELVASVQVQRDLTVQGPELIIRTPDELECVGNLERHEYFFMRPRRMAAFVSRRWCTDQRHSYGVDVIDGEDQPLVLATVLTLDMLYMCG